MIGQIASLDSTVYTQWIIYFFIYSVLGWFVNTIYHSIKKKRWTNTGFLRGPWMPSYGAGAIMGLLLAQWLPLNSLWQIPLLFIILSGVYSLFDVAFRFIITRIMPNGRLQKRHFKTCLFHGVLFALAAMLMLYVLHPLIQYSVGLLDSESIRYISWLVQLLLAIDFVLSINAIQKLQQKRRKHEASKHLNTPDDTIAWLSTLSGYERHMLTLYPQKDEQNLWQLFPLAKKYKREKRHASYAHALKTFFYWLLEAPQKDKVEEDSNPKSFAYGLNFYKLFWVFLISSIIGFVLETLFCLLTKGHLESRQGLLYGPFSQIYGFGAILMLLPTYPLRKKNNLIVFSISALVGGAFEALASLIQQYAFGSVSWQYDKYSIPLLGGRTSLVFMIMWGVLGIFLIRIVYPKLSRWIERIPNRQGIVLSYVLLILLLIDAALSAMAVYRWNQRLSDPKPPSAIAAFLDETYPNDYMEKVYPNMQHTR